MATFETTKYRLSKNNYLDKTTSESNTVVINWSNIPVNDDVSYHSETDKNCSEIVVIDFSP